MAVTFYVYPKFLQALLNKEHDVDSDALYMALLTSSYTPSDAHDYWNDVSANEITGTGYTANGKAITTPVVSYVEDTAGTAWATGAAKALGDLVRPTTANGHLYVCVDPGTTHATTEPTWPTAARKTVADNDVIWAECGRAVVVFTCDAVAWTSSTITARYAVVVNRTPGTDATRGLIAIADLGQNESTSNNTFTVTPSGLGLFRGFPDFPF